MTTKKKDTARDELVAAYESQLHELEQDEQKVREAVAAAVAAIDRFNDTYVSACQHRQAIIDAGGEAPPMPASPCARIGLIELPLLLEHPPRKRANLRRTPEQIEEERRKREEEYRRSRFHELPRIGHIPPDVPFGTGSIG